MLSEFAPDIVIGVGGYASGPAMLASGEALFAGV
jgi:UDP-N-acetylglucosamine:LPS N-acetylglucosamine transferase